MRAECMQAVATVIGRDLTVAEAKNIETRIRQSMQREAAKDPAAWRALSSADRLKLAGRAAAQEITAETAKKKQRLQLSIAAHDRASRYVESQVARKADKSKVKALSRMVAEWYDGRGNVQSVAANAKAIFGIGMGRLVDAFERVKPGFLGLLANKDAEFEMVKAVHGDPNVRAEFSSAAKAWRELTNELRERYNRAGGWIGALDDWGMPHAWSDIATKAVSEQEFIDDFLPRLRRGDYVHEDGRAYTDADLIALLKQARLSIVTNGANKPLQSHRPGGLSMKANRGGAHRSIHIADAEGTAYLLRKYSGMSVAGAMAEHVRRLSRDIALVEQFGPNADATFRALLDKYVEEAGKQGQDISAQVADVSHLYDHVAGNREPPVRVWLANGASAMRAWIRAAFLGSASVTAIITDPGTVMLTAKANGIPPLKVFWNTLRALNPANRDEKQRAMRAGLMVQTMTAQIDRFGADTLGHQIPDRFASAVFRVTGMNKAADMYRRAFDTAMLDAVGHITRKYATLAEAEAADVALLRGKGVTDLDWQVWRAATPEQWTPGSTVLTAQAVMEAPGFSVDVREQAATKLMAMTFAEQDFAIIEPGARERTWMTSGAEAGTVKGELVRSFFLLKAFPISVIARHWTRGLTRPTAGGKVAYMGTLLAAQTFLGAVAMGVGDILNGKEPTDMFGDNMGRAWLAAAIKGGSLGIYGDFLFADTTRYGNTLLGTLAGPVAGLIEDIDGLTRENMMQMSAGEETDFGAEAVKFVKRYTPGSTIWYTKAALDRNIFQQLQELMNPGYLSRMEAQQYQERGTEYFWRPGERLPEAPPDVGRIVGQ